MGKEILTFGDIEIEKKNYHRKCFLARFLLVKITINTLLVTYIMIIKFSHYI